MAGPFLWSHQECPGAIPSHAAQGTALGFSSEAAATSGSQYANARNAQHSIPFRL
jgi:hypothetical protein